MSAEFLVPKLYLTKAKDVIPAFISDRYSTKRCTFPVATNTLTCPQRPILVPSLHVVARGNMSTNSPRRTCEAVTVRAEQRERGRRGKTQEGQHGGGRRARGMVAKDLRARISERRFPRWESCGCGSPRQPFYMIHCCPSSPTPANGNR